MLKHGLARLREMVAEADSRVFDPLRSVPAFQALLLEAEAGRRRTLAAFREAGGQQLLGQ